MKKNIAAFITLMIIGTATAVNAKPNMQKPEMFKEILKKAAGAPGPFASAKLERFPKGYFLVPFNLPYLVGLSLFHPRSSELELSDEQIRAISQIKEQTVPVVLKKARKIKELELKLVNEFALGEAKAEDEYALVDEIAKLRAELTKEHLKCIEAVRKILTKEQYAKLQGYAKELK